ncbi:MAG: hypothetical protein ACREFX_01695 [Opitutaceae bacterium]
MQFRVLIETRAVRDLDEAASWIAAQSPEAAARWFDAIAAEIFSLAHFTDGTLSAGAVGRAIFF